MFDLVTNIICLSTILGVHGSVTNIHDFPNPVLTVIPTHVVRLTCRAHSGATKWDQVSRLEIVVALSPLRNQTIAVATRTSYPRATDVARISNVTGSGKDDVEWVEKTPWLSIVIPVDGKRFYTDYYCCRGGVGGVEHSDRVSLRDEATLRRIAADGSGLENVIVDLIQVDKVTITWKIPYKSQFIEGRVTRIHDNLAVEPFVEVTLLTLSDYHHDMLVHGMTGVLLNEVRLPSNEHKNYTIIVYSNPIFCFLRNQCDYSCLVLYPSCLGSKTLFCRCNNRKMTAITETYINLWKVSFFSLFTVIIIILGVALLSFSCRRKKWQSFFHVREGNSNPKHDANDCFLLINRQNYCNASGKGSTYLSNNASTIQECKSPRVSMPLLNQSPTQKKMPGCYISANGCTDEKQRIWLS